MSASNTSQKEEENEKESKDPLSALFLAAYSFLNLGLFTDAIDNLKNIDWFEVSTTGYHMGIIALSVWSLFIAFVQMLNYLLASPSLSSAVTRSVTVGPLIPFFLFIFAVFSSRVVDNLQETRKTEEMLTNYEIMFIFSVSLIALILAATFRWAIFRTAISTFGTSLPPKGVLVIMLVDGIYISLIFIGLGGIGSIIFEPKYT